MARKSKQDRAWNRLVAALDVVEELLMASEDNADELSALKTENKTLSKKLAVYDKAKVLLNGKDANVGKKTAKKRGKHRGRPKGSKNAVKKTVKVVKTKKVKAVKTVKKTPKPKTMKAVKAPVTAPKTETVPALAAPDKTPATPATKD